MQNECVLCAAHMQHVCLIHAGRLQICVQHTSNISVRVPSIFRLQLIPYVTVPGKRVLVAQIMIFLYRRFSATTPKNNSRDKTFVFVSAYTHAKFERVEVFLKGQARCLKTAT